MAATARTLTIPETDLYEARQLVLAAQHYDILAERAKQRPSRKRKSAYYWKGRTLISLGEIRAALAPATAVRRH